MEPPQSMGYHAYVNFLLDQEKNKTASAASAATTGNV